MAKAKTRAELERRGYTSPAKVARTLRDVATDLQNDAGAAEREGEPFMCKVTVQLWKAYPDGELTK